MFGAFEMIIPGRLRMVAQALFTEDTTNESPSVALISVSCCWNSLQRDLKNGFLQRTKQTKVIFSPRGGVCHLPACRLAGPMGIIWE